MRLTSLVLLCVAAAAYARRMQAALGLNPGVNSFSSKTLGRRHRIINPSSLGRHVPVASARRTGRTTRGRLQRASTPAMMPTGNLNGDTPVKVAIFSAAPYVREQLQPLMSKFPDSFFIEAPCSPSTAALCRGASAVCLFVNDAAPREVIEIFKAEGVKMIAMRCAGFDRVDLPAVEELGIKIARVPTYSPHAIAEHALSLALCLNRKIHRAYNRVREGNFLLSGLVGFDMKGKTVGIIGTGNIGTITGKIFKGLGMRVVGYDKFPNDDFKAVGEYMSLEEVVGQADVLSMHVPLTPETKYMVNKELISKMKKGVIFINCSRGGLVDTSALIDALKAGQIGAAGLDVYEQEGELFFKDLSTLSTEERMQKFDTEFALLRSFPNVIVTPHSAFLTKEALENICDTTILNIEEFKAGRPLTNTVIKK